MMAVALVLHSRVVPSLTGPGRKYNAPQHLRAGLMNAAPSGPLDQPGEGVACNIFKDPKANAVGQARLTATQ